MKIDLRDPTTWAALERQAYDGTVNLLPLPPAAYKYFSELTAVYRAFRFEGMPKQDAEDRKRLLRNAYDKQVQELHRAQEVYAEYQRAIRTAGTLISEINKAQTAESIAAIACKVIGLMTGDSSFYPLQMRKLEQIESKSCRIGRWIDAREHCDAFVCSECEHQSKALYGFCPGCGAKMNGGADK